MLMEAADSPDPAAFRDTELFKTCQAMGIIPATEADLARLRAATPSDDTIPESDNTESNVSEPEKLLLTLGVDGMWCPSCAWVIGETLNRHPGVSDARVIFSTDRLRCRYDPIRIAPDDIMELVRRLGYTPRIDDAGGNTHRRRETIRFAVSAVFTMNTMMLSWALYSGFFTHLSTDQIRFLSGPLVLLAAVPYVYGGLPLHRRAWAGLMAGAPGMETLISVAATAAFGYSLVNLFRGSLHIYCDTATMLITLTLLGKLLERGARDRVLARLESFFSLRPRKVKIVTDAFPRGRYAAADLLAKGGRFIAEAGEIVAADGRILVGTGWVDESSLTGEAKAVRKTSGDVLKSGTRILEGAFTLEAEAVGDDSLLGRMIALMEAAATRRTPAEAATDRLLRYFVPMILTLASGTGVVWRMLGTDVETAFIRAVTVMVISCPCALGIAIPLARVAGIAKAGENGILVRDFSAMEKVGDITAVVFDKTGTITEGRMRLKKIHPLSDRDARQCLALAAALEADSPHHLARAVRVAAGGTPAETVMITEVGADGIAGRWQAGKLRIGTERFCFERENSTPPVPPILEAGDSLVWMSENGRPLAALAFGDDLRPGALQSVERLAERGFSQALISGDDIHAVDAASRRLGINIRQGRLLPEEKADFIRRLQGEGASVLIVGDGINDAPAMVQADLAVAVFSGGPLGKEAAQATLMAGDLTVLIRFLDLAERVRRIVRQNLIFSFAYNFISIPIAMMGWLSPLVAVTAMLASSLSVIGNTLRFVRRG